MLESGREQFKRLDRFAVRPPRNAVHDATKFLFKRVLTLENPTHVPDFEKFRERYEQVARNEKCLALQGHPNSWNDERWANFVKIIEYLKTKGCVFMTPSEYAASLN